MKATQSAALERAVDALPQLLHGVVDRWLQRLEAAGECAGAAPVPAETLVRVVACSEFAAGVLLREWPWFATHADAVDAAPDPESLSGFVDELEASAASPEAIKERLRRFRNRRLLGLLWREIAGHATVEETVASLSDLADALLDAAAGYAGRQMRERFGVVADRHGTPQPIVILGMGKLGGRELNFSSDIDLIFLYPEGSESDGERRLSAQEYFARLARDIVSLLEEPTGDGFVFRVDTRLRPFGDSGPPVVSFAALESYLLQHGRGWERYAYVKARIVGPVPDPAVAAALRDDLVAPFVYRRYLDFGVFESLREMQARIAAEVRRRDLADNLKLGPGGIREIEFVVQSMQLVRGGSHPELQRTGLLDVLPKLVGRRGLSAEEAASLADAYRFLRRLENFIQAIRDQQTHELPADAIDRARLCVAMGYPDWEALVAELDRHRAGVAEQFGKIAIRQSSGGAGDGLAEHLGRLWDEDAGGLRWAECLGAEDFPDAAALAERIAAFANSPSLRRIDTIARERLRRFVPNLLLEVRESDAPREALARTLEVTEQILRRSAYLALLNENRRVMRRLVDLCGRSAFIAERIARHPVLLDELLDPRIYSEGASRREAEVDLRERLAATPADDEEEQMDVLARFQQANLFRIAVADFTGGLPIMKVSDALTDLAEIVLRHALHIAWREMTRRHGSPQYVVDGVTHRAGFGVVAYGKLGGIELSYGSDLDLVFLHDSAGEQQETLGPKPLDNAVFFARLVRRLVHILTTQTGSGALYEIDMRLRPDGRKGVLVTSVDAFERYQEQHAWTWEHQALLRARPVAGSARVGREFERIRAETLGGRVRRDALAGDVVSMRGRMREELDRGDASQFDLKQGSGGIGDIEFVVQYLVLANAGTHPAVIHYPDNIRQLATLAACGCLDAGDARRLQDVYRSYRLRLHHLSLDEQDPLVPGTEFTRERGDVRRIWERYLPTQDA
jgi:glutamate-ammonia-ligase adenylyltransferase